MAQDRFGGCAMSQFYAGTVLSLFAILAAWDQKMNCQLYRCWLTMFIRMCSELRWFHHLKSCFIGFSQVLLQHLQQLAGAQSCWAPWLSHRWGFCLSWHRVLTLWKTITVEHLLFDRSFMMYFCKWSIFNSDVSLLEASWRSAGNKPIIHRSSATRSRVIRTCTYSLERCPQMVMGKNGKNDALQIPLIQ